MWRDVRIAYASEPTVSEEMKVSVRRVGWNVDNGHEWLTSYYMGAFMCQPACRSLWAYFVGMAGLGLWREHSPGELDVDAMAFEAMCDRESVMARFDRVPVEDLMRCARDDLIWCRLMPLELRLRHDVYCQCEFGPGTIAVVATWCMVLWRMFGVDAVCPVVNAVLYFENQRCLDSERRRTDPRRGRIAGYMLGDVESGNSMRRAWVAVLSAVKSAASSLGTYDYGMKPPFEPVDYKL
jgi:hypothetical protein